MKMKYITKIKANVMIYSNKKVENLLNGNYNSIFKGRSQNFEDLREYVARRQYKRYRLESFCKN
ncbi:MAG: hypothetical protein HFJ50_07990 [Clostridia bacterium]|jgi:hypothetical protein|nr:hypothetical protein [Clostridia bacterium]